jgi:ribonuclease HI
MDRLLKIFSDGGARGNPGPSAYAFVVFENDKKIFQHSGYLGISTNNVAEYSAVLSAFNWLIKKDFISKEFRIIFFLDSELVVKQLCGLYRVKNKILKSYYQKIKYSESLFQNKVVYKHIYRDKNKLPDKLLNLKLDESMEFRINKTKNIQLQELNHLKTKNL